MLACRARYEIKDGSLMGLLTKRLSYGGVLAVAVLFISFSYYLEYSIGVIPCPLCMLQRYTFILLAACYFILIMMVNYRRMAIWFDGLALLLTSLGIILAGRQVWLQHVPPIATTGCGANLDYLLQVMPWDQVLKSVFQGTTECSRVDWRLWGLSLAEWSLLGFVTLLMLTLINLLGNVRKKP